MELLAWPIGEGADLTAVGRKGDGHPALPWVDLGPLDIDPTPIRVVGTGERRLGVVFGGPDATSDERAHAVSTYHDAGFLCHHCPTRGSSTDAANAVAVYEELLHQETLAQLGPGLHGRLDQDLVELAPLGCCRCLYSLLAEKGIRSSASRHPGRR